MASYLSRESAWKWHPPHRNRWTGKLCDCPWGQPKLSRMSSLIVEAGPNLNRVLKAPDKAYQTPEGQAFLQHLKRENEQDEDEHDSLMPWIAHRWKKGDIRLNPGWDQGEHDRRDPYLEYNMDPPGVDVPRWRPLNNRLPYWHQWYEARQHPTRRGVNVMDANWNPAAMDYASRRHQFQMQEAEERNHWLDEYANPSHRSPPNTVHRFGPEAGKYKNWQVVKLDPRQAEGDSEALGHCIGQDSQPYKAAIDRGDIDAYSLRDPEGYPHVSWHFNPSGQTIGHMQGKSGYPPEHYRNLIRQFHNAKGLPDDESDYEEEIEDPDQALEEIELPGQDNIDDYVRQHEAPYDFAPEDANYDDYTEFTHEPHDWDSIADDYLRNDAVMPGHDRRAFHNALRGQEEYEDMYDALSGAYDYRDPDHRTAIDNWNEHSPYRWNIDMPDPAVDNIAMYNRLGDDVVNYTPAHDDLAHEYLNKFRATTPQGRPNYTYESHPEAHQTLAEFQDNLRNVGDADDFADALRRNVNWQDPYHQLAMNKWNYAFPQNNVMPGQTPQQGPSVNPNQMKLVDYRNQSVYSPARGRSYDLETSEPWTHMRYNPPGYDTAERNYIDPDEYEKNFDYFSR